MNCILEPIYKSSLNILFLIKKMFQHEDSISRDGFGVSVWKSGVVDSVDLAPTRSLRS